MTSSLSPYVKNIVINSHLTAAGDIHIGDKVYYVERDFNHSILFLRLEPDADKGENAYTTQLSARLQHQEKDTQALQSDLALTEAVSVNIAEQLFRRLDNFQLTRRMTGDTFRVQGRVIPPLELYQEENALADALFETFFTGKIGDTCARFIELLHKNKLKELLLVVSTEDERVMNLPWEMVIARLFQMAGTTTDAYSMGVDTFGLVRSKENSLAAFDIRGKTVEAAPLKMLFVTALPEDMGERDKLLEIEDEQRKLIHAVGNLEANGSQPKIVIEFLDNASLPEIETALSERRHDILHISGHGKYLERMERGVLYMEDEFGDERKTSGAELGAVLRRHKSLKLLILSACETAVARKDGVVEQLSAESGIPAILAMRFIVTDPGAKQFTTALYDALAKGESLTQAVAQGRETLWRTVAAQRKNSPDVYHIADWFTPVLYLNQFVGAIVDVKKPYQLPGDFYPRSRFEAGERSRFIGQGFIGRKRYLIRLRKHFAQGRHVCLHGLGGMGKTTLAEAFVRNYRNRASKVLKFTGLEINLATLFDRIYEHFCTLPNADEGLKKSMAYVKDNKDMKPVQRLERLLFNCLDPNGTIFLFDNFEDVQTNGEGELQREINSPELLECLRYLCDKSPENCHVLFTTRYKIIELENEVTHLALGQLTYAEQYRLMNYATNPQKGNPFAKLGMPERETVIKRLDGHPRAYEFLEALLLKDRNFNWTKLDATLGKTEAQVLENLLLEKVYAQLTEEEKAIFQVASVFISRSPLAALVAVSEREEGDLVRVLQGLSEWSVCFWEQEKGEFEVHGLTRGWVEKSGLNSKEIIKSFANKIGDFYKNKRLEDDVILAVAYFEVAEEWEKYVDLAFSLGKHFSKKGFYQKCLELYNSIFEKNISKKANGSALHNFGVTLFRMGRFSEAMSYYNKSIKIKQESGDKKGMAITLAKASEIYSLRGDFDTSIKCLEKAHLLYQELEDEGGVAIVINNLATIIAAKGDFEKSIILFEKSLEINKAIKNLKGEEECLSNLGQIYINKGDIDIGINYLTDSLQICQRLGYKGSEATCWNNIGTGYLAKGDLVRAYSCFEEGLKINREIEDKNGEATNLNNLSQVLRQQGEFESAANCLSQSFLIHNEVGDLMGIASSVHNIGILCFDFEKYEDAMLLFLYSYAKLKKAGLPEVRHMESYLNSIADKIGDDRFNEILLQNPIDSLEIRHNFLSTINLLKLT